MSGTATASSVFGGKNDEFGPTFTIDGKNDPNEATRWKCNTSGGDCKLTITMSENKEFAGLKVTTCESEECIRTMQGVYYNYFYYDFIIRT